MIGSLLGLDIGTTSAKAVLFDLSGNELSRASSPPLPNHAPNPGWSEQDPEALWQAVLGVIHEVLKKTETSHQVLALSIAAQSGSLLPADAAGNPVYPLITWMDSRTNGLVDAWKQQGLENVVKNISGWSLYPGLCLPTIAWLRENNPPVFSAAKHYFSANDFITFRLTGKKYHNPSNAGGMQLVDIKKGKWSSTLCSIAGITDENLSPIQPTGAIIGNLLPDLANENGLTTQTLIINGGHDQGCTAVGLGINAPGKFLLACGTAWVITGVSAGLQDNAIPKSLDLNFHPAPDRWTLSQSLGGLGAAMEWWANQAWQNGLPATSREQAFQALNMELETTEPGSAGIVFLPMTGGHVLAASGQGGAFVGLKLGHSRADMGRSILESAAFELRWALEEFAGAGLPVHKLWVVGGAAQSPHWPGILSNGSKIPLMLPQYDNWPALGAAVIAGCGAGIFKSFEEGVSNFQKPNKEISIEQDISIQYDQYYQSYKDIYQNFYGSF